jgi:putative membrane protein
MVDMKAETFFTREENEIISETIREVETRTAGEVAVMVVDRSDSYPEARIMAGILLGGLLALIITDLYFHDSLWVFMPLAATLAFIIGLGAGFVPAALRLFVPAARLEARVQERALRAFYEKGLYKTRDNTGVLFFLSLLEHRIWLLADEGIYSKISQADLQEYAQDIAKSVKSGTTAAALCREIQNIGTVLAEHFPIKPDDINELSDHVLYE